MSGNASIAQSEANAVQLLEECGNPALTFESVSRQAGERSLIYAQFSIFYYKNMLCPGSPAYMHASCQLSASFSSNCNNVIKEITDRVEANKNGTWYEQYHWYFSLDYSFYSFSTIGSIHTTAAVTICFPQWTTYYKYPVLLETRSTQT